MEITEEDRRVARLATELLSDWNRPELAVTPEQVIRWRQVAHAIPVAGNRRGGRNQVTRYLPDAPAAAAGIALALADGPRDLDLAVLAAYGNAVAFGTGEPPAFEGVRLACRHYLRDAEGASREAWAYRGKPRSAVPKRLRVPFKGSRRSGAAVVSDTLLSVLLGIEGSVTTEHLAYTVEEFLPEATPVLAGGDGRRRLRSIMTWLSLAALRRSIDKADPGRFAEACRNAAALIGYFSVVSDLTRATGSDAAALPTPVGQLASIVQSGLSMTKGPLGVQVVVLGLVFYVTADSSHARRQMTEAAEGAANYLPHMSAQLAIAELLPEHLRPAMGLNGAVFQAQLPQEDRELVQKTTREWLDRHPAIASAVGHPETSRQEAGPSNEQ